MVWWDGLVRNVYIKMRMLIYSHNVRIDLWLMASLEHSACFTVSDGNLLLTQTLNNIGCTSLVCSHSMDLIYVRMLW
jgi:hypothetical protein